MRFTATRSLACLSYRGHILFCSVGFEESAPPVGAAEVEVDAAHLTVILAELKPRPVANVFVIRNVVEASDRESDPKYSGHDFKEVEKLFPPIQLFEVLQGNPTTWNVFFQACINECEVAGSWIDGKLSSALRSISELAIERIPYAMLCKSIFDADPGSFFLALYRCLEWLYWYASARDVVAALKLTTPWPEVASALEDVLSWYPREEQSLVRLMELASAADLTTVLQLLDVPGKVYASHSASSQAAARRIYKLRNSLVHYRPAQQRAPFNSIDWAELGSVPGRV